MTQTLEPLKEPLEAVLQVIQAVKAVIKARQRIPTKLQGPTYYSVNDQWMFEESESPHMCSTCQSMNLEIYSGTDLRTTFPDHEVISEDFIYPRVHPNCMCGLTRVYPVEVVGESQ